MAGRATARGPSYRRSHLLTDRAIGEERARASCGRVLTSRRRATACAKGCREGSTNGGAYGWSHGASRSAPWLVTTAAGGQKGGEAREDGGRAGGGGQRAARARRGAGGDQTSRVNVAVERRGRTSLTRGRQATAAVISGRAPPRHLRAGQAARAQLSCERPRPATCQPYSLKGTATGAGPKSREPQANDRRAQQVTVTAI
ncbi:hypothetical protein BDY21DRAFT_421641 [Lineolata rhizophorae]|uniref:Uncharacterized protein n=1 Tax=Lineolata rhizophorae TaxID=578093 RepID=A0A6A6P0N3_9PEZI|nr:hypothetical protein BDY21DRAFT_421641 [Lineolata rhizophorae]